MSAYIFCGAWAVLAVLNFDRAPFISLLYCGLSIAYGLLGAGVMS